MRQTKIAQAMNRVPDLQVMDLLEKQAIRSFEKHQDLFPPLQTVTQMTAKTTTLSGQEIQHSFQTLSEMMEKIRQEETIVSIQFQELVSLHKQHQGRP